MYCFGLCTPLASLLGNPADFFFSSRDVGQLRSSFLLSFIYYSLIITEFAAWRALPVCLSLRKCCAQSNFGLPRILSLLRYCTVGRSCCRPRKRKPLSSSTIEQHKAPRAIGSGGVGCCCLLLLFFVRGCRRRTCSEWRRPTDRLLARSKTGRLRQLHAEAAQASMAIEGRPGSLYRFEVSVRRWKEVCASSFATPPAGRTNNDGA